VIQDGWLLKDEEIKKVIGKDRWNYATSNGKASFDLLALLQDAKTKQKLVKWIDSMGDYSVDFSVDTFGISKEDWQALREEVGLED